MIVAATGSGCAAPGLMTGNRLLHLNRRTVAVNVCGDRDYFPAGIGTICEAAIATYGMDIPFERERDIDIGDDQADVLIRKRRESRKPPRSAILSHGVSGSESC